MKAAVITSHGLPEDAFEFQEVPIPEIGDHEVLVKVEAIGLNYADVMCRMGLYSYSPPLPSIVGYDVVGEIVSIGAKVDRLTVGDRVMAITPFGGYAEYAKTVQEAAVRIDDQMDTGVALALLTQYCTAYFCAEEMVRPHPGDHILIHAAAGGVGIALTQLLRRYGCTLYGTVGNDAKIDFIRKQGIHHPINYRSTDFEDAIISLRGNKGLDVIFDSVGGETFQKGYHLLRSGGRIVVYGSAEVTGRDAEGQMKIGRDFGTYHPLQLMIAGKSIIGVFMLLLFEDHPEKIQSILQCVLQRFREGDLNPVIDKSYNFEQMAEAHTYLESRRSIGKIIVHI